MTAESTTRTITLTERPPVKITTADWPIIAESTTERGVDHNCQWDRRTIIDLRVRRHRDGRALVYGAYVYETRWQGESDHTYRDGLLLPPTCTSGHIIDAISRIGASLAERSSDETSESVRACIADLPAEEI